VDRVFRGAARFLPGLKRSRSEPVGQVTPSQHLVELRAVVKTYQTEAGGYTALKGVDLTVERGEFAAVIGKSGSGKSTLINMITGIDRPTSGQVWVDGTAVHTLSEEQLAQWRGRCLGVVFQFFQLLPTLNLLQNVMLPMDFCNTYGARERRERAMHLLEQMGLADRANKRPSAISGGQQQRVAIARALANDPPLIVADEPTGNLDSRTAASIFDLFHELVSTGKTIIMVTHDNELASHAARSVLVADGEVVNEYVVSAFRGMDVEQLSSAAANLRSVAFPPGAVIIRQGDTAEDMYIIVKGRVDVLLEQGGEEVKVASLSSGQYFGEIGVLQGGRRTATVRAAFDSEVEVMALDRATFSTLMEGAHVTREAFTEEMRERLAALAAASVR
jgi:putative ABC transport system ATP-binding protein